MGLNMFQNIKTKGQQFTGKVKAYIVGKDVRLKTAQAANGALLVRQHIETSLCALGVRSSSIDLRSDHIEKFRTNKIINLVYLIQIIVIRNGQPTKEKKKRKKFNCFFSYSFYLSILLFLPLLLFFPSLKFNMDKIRLNDINILCLITWINQEQRNRQR